MCSRTSLLCITVSLNSICRFVFAFISNNHFNKFFILCHFFLLATIISTSFSYFATFLCSSPLNIIINASKVIMDKHFCHTKFQNIPMSISEKDLLCSIFLNCEFLKMVVIEAAVSSISTWRSMGVIIQSPVIRMMAKVHSVV